jgi:zinc finger protein 423
MSNLNSTLSALFQVIPRESTQNSVQMNAVNKVNSLSSVTVTSSAVSSQPHRVRQTMYVSQASSKCFICDEHIMNAATVLKETETQTSHEKVTKKLARLVGDDFCVIVSEDDVICRRCLTLFNTMDKYEYDLENVKSRLNK